MTYLYGSSAGKSSSVGSYVLLAAHGGLEIGNIYII